MEENKKEFIELLKSVGRAGINDLINYLENETDFFISPASSKYHLSFPGGLLQHSLNVYKILKEELKNTKYDDNTIKLVSLLHDVCKANYYKLDYKNAKINNEWKQVEYYTVDDQLPLGHGEKSVMIVSDFIYLTREEKLAIRWHMGAFESKENYSYINKVFRDSELAFYLHIADLKATYIIEKES